MNRKLLFLLSTLIVASVLLAACATPTPPPPTPAPPTTVPSTLAPTAVPWTAPKGALVSYPVKTAPNIDGNADDAAWVEAQATIIPVTTYGIPTFNWTVKSVYTTDTVYFLIQYPDANQEFSRGLWAYDPTTKSWGRISDDFNDEDEFGLFWNINMPNYATAGCTQACHNDKMVAPTGTSADLWQWTSVRTNPMGWAADRTLGDNINASDSGGFVDDAGVEKDPGFVDNLQTIGKVQVPLYWKPFSGASGISSGSPLFLLKSEIDSGAAKKIVSVDASGVLTDETGTKVPLWVHIPGWIDSQPGGPVYGDIAAKGTWADGVWTVELSRKLDTGSTTDVQFKDLTATYYWDAYVKTRQTGESAHGNVPTTPFVFSPTPYNP
jgi:hypothetical protein